MVKALTEHPNLNDDVQFMPVEFGEYLVVGFGVLAAVDVVGPHAALTICRNDLLGVLHVQR